MTTVAENHAGADAFIARCQNAPQSAKPCCFKGCHACCYEAVYASEAEADYIIEAMTPEQRSEVSAKLNDWFEKVRAILFKKMPNAMLYRKLNVPCPLLKDGLCSVYERRPFGCRAFFAIGNPKDCDLPARSHQKFAVFPDAIFRASGAPATVNGSLRLDHLGVWLLDRLLGLQVHSGSRITLSQKHIARAEEAGKFMS